MFAKGGIHLIWRRIFLQLKNLRFFLLAPPVALFVVPPLILIPLIQNKSAFESVYGLILQYSQTVLPLFSVWWIIFVSREYVESDGNELLYVFRPRTLFREYLILFALYMLLLLSLFLFLSVIFPYIIPEYIRIFCICAMFFGITYSILYITGSMPLTFMIILVYSLINMVMPIERQNLFLYNSNQHFDPSMMRTICIPQLIAACVFTVIGYIANKKYVKYR